MPNLTALYVEAQVGPHAHVTLGLAILCVS